jgi:hypothetical protein
MSISILFLLPPFYNKRAIIAHMERKYRRLLASLGVGLLSLAAACGPIGGMPTNAAQATAASFDCSQHLTFDKLNVCATKASETISGTAILKQIIDSSFVAESYRSQLIEPIATINQIVKLKKSTGDSIIQFFEYKRDGAFGHAFIGCGKTDPFVTELVLPKPLNYTDEILDVKWHEYHHLHLAYQRYLNNALCPFDRDLSEEQKKAEELETDYWGQYVQAAARRFGYTSQSKKTGIKENGRDPADIVYEVLEPAKIGPDNWLYEMIVYNLSTRFIYINIIGKERIPSSSTEIQDTIKETESSWAQHLQTVTPQEKEAIKKMVELKLVAPDFFPMLPK